MTRLSDLTRRLRPVVEGSFGSALLDELEAEITHAQEGEGVVLGLNDALRDGEDLLHNAVERIAKLNAHPPYLRAEALADLAVLIAKEALDEHDAMVAERPPWQDVGHRTEAL